MVKRSKFALITGTILLAALPASVGAQRDFTEESAPFHSKVDYRYQFNLANASSDITEVRHASTALGWTFVSQDLTDNGGMFPKHRMYLGITKEGEHQGAIYTGGMQAIAGATAATNSLNTIGSLGFSAEGGEELEVPLGPVETTQIPVPNKPGESENIYFRKFSLPSKAYRMMGVLPDENRLRFVFKSTEGRLGALAYFNSGRPQPNIWAYSIGYAKELSQLARQ